MAAKPTSIKAALRKRMHEPIKDTGDWLRAVARGFNHHVVAGKNSRLRLRPFRHDVICHRPQAVGRRSQRPLVRAVFDRIVTLYLPTPAIPHPYALERFGANHPR